VNLQGARNILILLFIAVLPILRVNAQQGHFNAFDGVMNDCYGDLDKYGSTFHVSVQPWLEKEVYRTVHTDSIYRFYTKNERKTTSSFLSEHSVDVKKGNVRFRLDPLVDAVFNADIGGNGLSGGGALGLSLTADLGKRFTIGGYGSFHQESFPKYIEDYIEKTRVVPGSGYAQNSVAGGHYYWDWDVYANYAFLKYFNLEAGMGRNFWGDGYRTFFLSDNAFSYPYIKLTTSVWHIKYVNLYAQFNDMSNTSSSLWGNMRNKYGSFHFLNWDISKRVNLGFFEAVIWQERDSVMNRGFDVNYINPLIFFRPVEFSIGDPDNTLMGLSLKVRVAKKNIFYGQFLIDDMIWSEFLHGSINRIKHWLNKNDSSLKYGYWTNKQAYQIGFKSYDIFKIRNLDVQAEFNFARPYTYSHRYVISNYGHYNEPLAHPLGANFSEMLGFLRYRFGRWFLEGEASFVTIGLDSAGTHYGQDIYKPTFDTYYADINNVPVQQYYNSIGQGIKTHILYGSLRACWLINPASNLRGEVEIAYRRQSSVIKTSSGLIFSFGIKTSWHERRMDQ
jgi:hypothetical protein